MEENDRSIQTPPHFRLRRIILLRLYAFFQEHPFAAMETGALAEACDAAPRSMNWNLAYLEKCGLIELNKSPESYPYPACSVAIAARGIDLVENPPAFDARFPDSSDSRETASNAGEED